MFNFTAARKVRTADTCIFGRAWATATETVERREAPLRVEIWPSRARRAYSPSRTDCKNAMDSPCAAEMRNLLDAQGCHCRGERRRSCSSGSDRRGSEQPPKAPMAGKNHPADR